MSQNIAIKEEKNNLSLIIEGAKEIGFCLFEAAAFAVFAVGFCFFVAVI